MYTALSRIMWGGKAHGVNMIVCDTIKNFETCNPKGCNLKRSTYTVHPVEILYIKNPGIERVRTPEFLREFTLHGIP